MSKRNRQLWVKDLMKEIQTIMLAQVIHQRQWWFDDVERMSADQIPNNAPYMQEWKRAEED